MSPSPDQNPSSLDPELLRELEAAEAGLPSTLLNDIPLLDLDLLGDDTPLIALSPDGNLIPTVRGRLRHPPRTPDTTRAGALDQIPEPATATTSPVATANTDLEPDDFDAADAAPLEIPEDSDDGFEEEQPLTQSMLDDLAAAEDERRERRPENTTEAAAPAREPHGHASTAGQFDSDTAEGWTGDLLTQADPGAMVDQQSTGLAAPHTDEASAPPESGLLSQDDLDALIAGDMESADSPDTESDGPRSREDLDAFIASESDDSEDPDAPEPVEIEPLSQEALDALLSGEEFTSDTPDVESDGPLSQEDLDALIAGEMESTDTPTTDSDAPLSQADLDALMEGSTGAAASAGSEKGDDTLSQEELDALLAAAAGGATPPPASKNAPSPTASPDIELQDMDALIQSTDDDDENSHSALSLSDDDLDSLFDQAGEVRHDQPLGKDDDGPLDQASLDALLADAGDEQILSGDPLDASVVDTGAGSGEDVPLTRSSIDALMSDLVGAGDANALDPVPDEAEDESGEISQDMIDALIASAQAEAPGARSPAAESEVGSENLAAAATVSDSGPDLLSQSDLDKLIEESKKQDKVRNKNKQRGLEEAIAAAQNAARGGPAPAPEVAPRKRPRFRKPGMLRPLLQKDISRLAASILVGFIAAGVVGATLYFNREQVRYGPSAESVMELQVAVERAQGEIDRGDYAAAIGTLERPIQHALPSTLRGDAQYLLLEARYRAFRGVPGTAPFDEMTARIDEAVAQAPNHPRAPEALYWKALHLSNSLPQTALEVYAKIFQDYAAAPEMDRMLRDAAQLALAQKDPHQTAIYAQDLLRRFPGSPWAGEAILAMGDANVLAGNTQDARAMFVRMADAQPDSQLGAEAYLRLGHLAYDMGQFDQAIMQLERRLETATTTRGNDEVYLLLAQAYRKTGQLNAARDTLTDLLNVFEPGPVTPRAYIEYSQVFEALGERQKAVKTAERAALEYPNNPDVLRNHGEFQGLNGNPLTAAIALMAAEKAGAADPNLLLTAARHYRTANMPREATATYTRLKTLYGGSPASIAGGVEAAELRYDQGQAEGALEDLKALQAATRGTGHYLSTVQSMLGIYKDLGLTGHVRTLAAEVAQLAEEPETIAQAAIDLMGAGDLEQAQRALERVDLARLKTRTAFNIRMKEGESLIAVAPQRGLEKMEEAYFNYPEARTPEADQKLLETYLLTGRPAAARRMVMDLKASTEQTPMNAPYLVDAAVAWGNYLYDREDYRTAVFAYSLAEEAGTRAGKPVAGLRSHPDWARYQRANALLRLADYAGCLPLFEQIAASDSPWAGEAAVKANLARLEQRQRGMSVAAARAG